MKVSLLPEQSNQLNSSFSNSNGATTGIVFIDRKVDDYKMLIAGVTPDLEVVLLDDNFDEIATITQALKGRRGLSSLHIVAHGEAGKLLLGKGFVDSSTLELESDKLQSWAAALAPDADILLYGCNVAAGETGRQFVQLFSQLTVAFDSSSSNLVSGDTNFSHDIFLYDTVANTTRRVSVATDGNNTDFCEECYAREIVVLQTCYV